MSHLASTIATAEQCGIDPSRLIVEIQQDVSVFNPTEVSAVLDEVRRSGVRISIGDFGSGYSGLALLDHYRPDMISLDGALMRNIDTRGPLQAIVRGLVQTSEDLGIDLIAGAVETQGEFAWLLNEGFHLFSGSLIAEPGFEDLPTPRLPLS